MRKRLVSFCAVLLCGIFSVTCLMPAAAAFSNLDNMGIDPWGDLEGIKNPVIEETPIVPELPDSSVHEFPVDEGGISLLSLNDENYNRTLSMKGYVRYGFSYPTPDDTGLVSAFSKDLTANSGNTSVSLGIHNSITNTLKSTYVLRVSGGTTVDYVAPVNYVVDDFTEILLTSSGQFYFSVANSNLTSYPDEMTVLVNGEEYGEIIPASEGFSFSALSLPLTEDIHSLGYRFFWNNLQAYSGNGTQSTVTGVNAVILDNATFVVTEMKDEPEYNGLLGTIIGWLQNLWNAITGLGDTIVNGLLDGISGLFVPTEEEITEMKDQYSNLLSERLGFIYQAYEWTISSAEEIVDTMESQEEYTFTFPGISIPYQGQTLTIVPQQPVSMENAVMDVLRPVLGTIISLVSVAAFAHTAFDMVTALISGVSYFGFLKGKRGGNSE